MSGPLRDGRTSSARVRCVSCGTVQEAPATDAKAVPCAVCGAPLDAVPAEAGPRTGAASQPAAAPSGQGVGEVFELGDEAAAKPGAAVPAEAPATRPPEVDEILANRKRITSLLALVPVVGLWALWGSDSHATGEKVTLSVVSAALTGAIVFAIFTALPDREDRLAARRQQVAVQLDALGALVERYRSENGFLPEETTWALSTKRSDPRFVDPWQRPYVYERRNGGFVVGTYGRDGIPGGDDEDDDAFVQGPENPR